MKTCMYIWFFSSSAKGIMFKWRSLLAFQVTVFKQYASRLAALNDRLIGIKVGDFW